MKPKLVIKYVINFFKLNSRQAGIATKKLSIKTLKLTRRLKGNSEKFLANLQKNYQNFSWQKFKNNLKTSILTLGYYVKHPQKAEEAIKKVNFKTELQKLSKLPQKLRQQNKLVQQQFLAFTSLSLALIILTLGLIYLPQEQKTLEENTSQKLAETDLEQMDVSQKTNLEQEEKAEITTTDKNTATNTFPENNSGDDNPDRKLANLATNEGGTNSGTNQASGQNSGANNNPNPKHKNHEDKDIIRRGEIDDSAADSRSVVPQSYQTYSTSTYNLHYPSILAKQTSDKNSLRLVHSIDHQHTDPCTQKSDTKFTDFDVYFQLYNQGLLETIKEVEGADSEIVNKYVQETSVDTSSQDVQAAKLDSYYGYKIKHKEECGYYNYYISATPIHTMHIKRQVVTEYQQTDADKYQGLEQAISTSQATDYLNKIMKYLELKQE